MNSLKWNAQKKSQTFKNLGFKEKKYKKKKGQILPVSSLNICYVQFY